VSHTILGGYTMAARLARYDLLGTGARPTDEALANRKLVDELDVADLESEAVHGYRLFAAYSTENRLTVLDGRADAGRAARTRDRFTLKVARRGTIVMRCGAEAEGRIRMIVGGTVLPPADVTPTLWAELRFEVPPSVNAGNVDVTVEGLGTTFESLHYWSYE
jgi:hypothetical protein